MVRRRRGTAKKSIKRFGEAPNAVQRRRAVVVMVGFFLLFTAIGGRLGVLHLNPSLELTEEERHHIGQIQLNQPRGAIRDCRGLLLATDRKAPSVWVDPRKVRDPEGLAQVCAVKLGMPREEVLARLTKRNAAGNLLKFMWVKRWVSEVPESELRALTAQSGGALAVQEEAVRFYPQGDTASHLLGFVNRAGEASEGVENTFNTHLHSVPGWRMARKDGSRKLLESLTLDYAEPEGGEDVYLTLDMDVQHTLEQALDRRMEECNAPRAMGMVMDAHTGAILALASRPAFDPNQYDTYPAELRKNRALLDVFEPGSAFKIVTASAALEHGLVTVDTLIDCENGRFNPYGHTIKDVHKCGVIPFSECFAESSNIAMVKVAAMLGPDRLEAWIRRFGFGEVTSRDFQFESRGIFRQQKDWSGLSMGALPIGQEIAVTIPQLAKAYAIIANGGYEVEPYFVDRAQDQDGFVSYRHLPVSQQRVLSEATAQQMQDLCHQVVMHGTGKQASIEEYRVGGKTGTAQMARKDGRGYDADRYTTVFAGFAPVVSPKLVAVIVVQEPMIRLHYGGHVCGPVFKEVVREALVRLNVPEDPVVVAEEATEKEELVEEVFSSASEQAVADADTVAPRVAAAEMDTSLLALLEPVDGLELVARPTDDNPGVFGLPDFRGMTKREAREKLWALGIAWDTQGAGRVVAQQPAPGTPLSDVALCALEFSTGE